MTCSSDDFRLAMRGLASGISLIATRDENGMPHGMAATAVCSVSAEPPTLLVCIAKTATLHDIVSRAKLFSVNFLAESQKDLVRVFSSREMRSMRFDYGTWTDLETGAPVLNGAVANLDCRLDRVVDAGTHTIFFGSVQATRLAPHAAAPLVHHDGHMSSVSALA